MKVQQLIFLFIMALLNSVGNAQTETSFIDIKHESRLQSTSANLDAKANLLSLELKQKVSKDKLKKHFNILERQGTVFVPALVKLSVNFNHALFDQLHIHVNTIAGNIYSIQIPLASYQQFIKEAGIIYLELALRTYTKLDYALKESKIDLIHQGLNLSQPYTGKDVVVGILDIGFDYTHPTFANSKDGSSRIMRSWEQNFGNKPPNGFSYGSEFNSLEMLIEKFDFNDTGHGTHVASVAAGNGGSLQDKHRGVAYESDIVLVSTNVLEGYNGLNTGIIDGINYVFQYAESVGKPAVINISQGHHTGPHDGTSLTDQAIDALTGPGKIIVGAAGNEGDPSEFYLHWDHIFDDEKSILSYLVWPEGLSSGETDMEIWGDSEEKFKVSVEVYNPKTKIAEASSELFGFDNTLGVTSGVIVDQENDTITYVVKTEINPLNNRPHMSISVNSNSQSRNNDVDFADILNNDFIQLRFQAEKGKVHAYAANNIFDAFFTDLSGIGAAEFIDEVRVLGGNPDYTIGELGGTAHSIISVGGYITKNTILNTAGEQLGSTDEIGNFYFRSSRGPTHDGRMKPDITAPAGWIAAAANSFNSLFIEEREIDKIDKPDGGKWSFSVRRGTSVSSPIVAGVVALMLEVNPELTPSEIKDLLRNLSDQDNFTGTAPGNLWGYGKINAHNLIAALDISTAINPLDRSEEVTVYPNPSTGLIYLNGLAPGSYHLEMLDVSGRVVFNSRLNHSQNSVMLRLPNLQNGIYFLTLDSPNVSVQKKLVIDR